MIIHIVISLSTKKAKIRKLISYTDNRKIYSSLLFSPYPLVKKGTIGFVLFKSLTFLVYYSMTALSVWEINRIYTLRRQPEVKAFFDYSHIYTRYPLAHETDVGSQVINIYYSEKEWQTFCL